MIQRPVLLAFLLLQVIDKATVNELKNFLCIEEKKNNIKDDDEQLVDDLLKNELSISLDNSN